RAAIEICTIDSPSIHSVSVRFATSQRAPVNQSEKSTSVARMATPAAVIVTALVFDGLAGGAGSGGGGAGGSLVMAVGSLVGHAGWMEAAAGFLADPGHVSCGAPQWPQKRSPRSTAPWHCGHS